MSITVVFVDSSDFSCSHSLTCSGAARAGKNAATRISRRRGKKGTGDRSDAIRGTEGPRWVTNCNHGQQSGKARGQRMYWRKEPTSESALPPTRELSRVHSDCQNVSIHVNLHFYAIKSIKLTSFYMWKTLQY